MALSISPNQLTLNQQDLRANNPPSAKNVRVGSEHSSDTADHVVANGSPGASAVESKGWGFPAIRNALEASQAAGAASEMIAQQPAAAMLAQANSNPQAVLAMLRA